MKTQHPELLLAYIPANCTSEMQIADLALNAPFKQRYTTLHVMAMIRSSLACMNEGRNAWEVVFCKEVSKIVKHAMECILQSFCYLKSIKMEGWMRKVGHDRCWDDGEFRKSSLQRNYELITRITDDINSENIHEECDEDDFLQDFETNGFSGQEKFFEVVSLI